MGEEGRKRDGKGSHRYNSSEMDIMEKATREFDWHIPSKF